MKNCCAAIVERTDAEIEKTALSDLTEAVGWGRRSDEKWHEILTRSKYLYSLWSQDKLVGFGRILEDGTMAMFYDIAVHPDYQGQGLGTRIMRHLLSKVADKGYASIGLFAWDKNPKNIEFYEQLGFKQVNFGMKLKPAASEPKSSVA